MNTNLTKCLLTALLGLSAAGASAKVELPDIISDNAVLQQNSDARLWGWSKPGSTVDITTSWDGKTYSVTSDRKNGRWETAVTTPEASFTPYSIEFKDADVEFIKVIDRSHIQMRVWERGSGETMACGTGACAAVVAGVLNNLTDREVNVWLPGGTLKIRWDEVTNHVFLTGPAEFICDGEYYPPKDIEEEAESIAE